MSQPINIPGVMRHAVFGDEGDSTKMYVVPEDQCHIELHQQNNNVVVKVHFKGRNVTIPHGTTVVFHTLAAVNKSGCHVVEEKKPTIPNILKLTPEGHS